jgi:tRNA(Met) C34 N-acetyltransferase TmcA
LPWLAASIRLSQEAFKLLYLSEISEEGNSCQVKIWDWVRESNKDGDLTPYQRLQAHAAFAFGIATGGDCDNPPRKIPYYLLRPIHFVH